MKRRIGFILVLLGICIYPVFIAEEHQKVKVEKGGGLEPSERWKWANFILLGGILGYVIVKKGTPFFTERAAEIRKGIEDADRVKADSEAKIAAVNSKLGRLDAEIASLRETALAERRTAEQRINADKVKELERIRLHAESEIESAGKSERIALQRYAAKLALELAEAKVRARMNPDAEDALVRMFVRDLTTPSSSPGKSN
jgi:F-type H+-transporting ATPase subunit b